MPEKVLLNPTAGTEFYQPRRRREADGNMRLVWSQYTTATSTSSIVSRPFTQLGKLTGAGDPGRQHHCDTGHARPGRDFLGGHAGRLAVERQWARRRAVGSVGQSPAAPSALWTLPGNLSLQYAFGGLAVTAETAVAHRLHRRPERPGCLWSGRAAVAVDLSGLAAPELIATANAPAAAASVALADDGTAYLLWNLAGQNETGAWLSVLSSGQTFAGPARQTNAAGLDINRQIIVAAGPSSTCVAVWRRLDISGNTTSLVAQRFDATAARRLGNRHRHVRHADAVPVVPAGRGCRRRRQHPGDLDG